MSLVQSMTAFPDDRLTCSAFLSTDADPLDFVAASPYDTNIVSLRDLSDKQEQALLAGARAGDEAARDEVFAWLLLAVKRFAARYFLAYSWETTGAVSVSDLVSEASLRMLECWPVALTTRNPFAYLLKAAYGTIRRMMWQERSPIHTPYTPGERPIPVKSLDAPLDADSDNTLLDLLPAGRDTSPVPADELDCTPIYEAAARLSEREQAVIAEWYGMYETAPAAMEAVLTHIGRAGMGSYKASALTKLYRLLAPLYPQYCGGDYVQDLRRPGRHLPLSDSQQQKLDAACAQLHESGQRVSVHGLSQATGVQTGYVSSYLHQQGYARPSRQHKLDEAYTQLHESGQKITACLLAQTAHVNVTHASLYLQQRGDSAPGVPRFRSTQDRAQRVAAAYAQLQQSGQPISRRTLGTAAHVNWHYASGYLKQQRANV